MTEGECETLQDDIFELLIPNITNHVATFGNTITKNAQDWVPIQNAKPSVKVCQIYYSLIKRFQNLI